MKPQIIDHGHHVAAPLPSGARRLKAGETLQLCLGAQELSAQPAFVLEAGAHLELTVLIFPGQDRNLNVTVDFIGEGATASLSGLYICSAADRLSLKVEVRHRVGGCSSNQLFRGIVADRANVTFDGRIVVAPEAQKTKALQACNNILLSAEAVAQSLPQLEIYADDVECSHGATVGALNTDEQYYMRSRGIPEDEVKVLQMISFLSPVLAGMADARKRAAVKRRIGNIVRSL